MTNLLPVGYYLSVSSVLFMLYFLSLKKQRAHNGDSINMCSVKNHFLLSADKQAQLHLRTVTILTKSHLNHHFLPNYFPRAPLGNDSLVNKSKALSWVSCSTASYRPSSPLKMLISLVSWRPFSTFLRPQASKACRLPPRLLTLQGPTLKCQCPRG